MIAIIDYNAGNISSVQNALNRLGFESTLTNKKEEILKAEKVILPGVGEASSAMKYLIEQGLDKVICSINRPLLGICLGMQLMCKYSEEGDTNCLGIFDAKVKRFPPKEKVPHMGWNNFSKLNGQLFQGIDKSDDMYFVHSYFAEINENTAASCNYIRLFSAAFEKDNFFATQFHPEKSGDVGERLLKNFLTL